MEIVFWLAIFLITYSYVIYPVILAFLSKLRTRNIADIVGHSNSHDLPNVAVIIAAYNEESDIVERIENLARLDYPCEKLSVYIGSDGSDDNTNVLIESNLLKNISFSPFEQRRGKASVLNDLCKKSQEKILIFSDANTLFDVDAIKKLVSCFEDPSVGGVCGDLEIHTKSNSSNHDGVYWKYEKFIKVKENAINGILGANGAIYAIRKELFKPISSDTVTDDFMIAMNVVLQGYKMVYEPQAIAHEYAPDTMHHEFKRRVRIGMGNYQAFFRLAPFLNPFNSSTHFFTYISHKVIRWFTPHLLIVCLVMSVLLVNNSFYMSILLLQVSVYLFSMIAMKYSLMNKLPKLLNLIVFFISMNAALFVGFIKYSSSNINPAWDRTTR